MMKFLVGIIILIGVIYFIIYDIKTIYNKNILSQSYVIIETQGYYVELKKENILFMELQNILNNKKNKWNIAFGSYATDVHIRSKENYIAVDFLISGYILVSYKTVFGKIILISEDTFKPLRNKFRN